MCIRWFKKELAKKLDVIETTQFQQTSLMTNYININDIGYMYLSNGQNITYNINVSSNSTTINTFIKTN